MSLVSRLKKKKMIAKYILKQTSFFKNTKKQEY